MGCGVNVPNLELSEDWGLEDPYGNDIDFYRKTRDKNSIYYSNCLKLRPTRRKVTQVSQYSTSVV